MKDIDQFRALLNGDTETISTDQIIPKKAEKHLERWTGMVINNFDPDKQGKVQIKIYGYYDDLALANIPWAIPDIKSFTSTKGNFIVPEINTIVRGYFDNGDDSKPIYDSIAFNEIYNSKDMEYLEWEMRTNDYPYSMVLFQTDQKDYLVMNKKTGEISFTHHTGTITKIDQDGNIDINTASFSGGPANFNVNIAGNVNLNSSGKTSVKAKKNVIIQSVNGDILLGNNQAKQYVNNLKTCLICGAPHAVGNVQVKA